MIKKKPIRDKYLRQYLNCDPPEWYPRGTITPIGKYNYKHKTFFPCYWDLESMRS